MTYEPIISPTTKFLEDKILKGSSRVSRTGLHTHIHTGYMFSICVVTEQRQWDKRASMGTVPAAITHTRQRPLRSCCGGPVLKQLHHANSPALIYGWSHPEFESISVCMGEDAIRYLISSTWFLFTKKHCNLMTSLCWEIFCINLVHLLLLTRWSTGHLVCALPELILPG